MIAEAGVIDLTDARLAQSSVADAPLSAIEQTPQLRPRINRNRLPTVVRQSTGRTLVNGRLGIEASNEFLQFVSYHRAFSEAMVSQWYALAEAVTIGAVDRGTEGQVEFVLDKTGNVGI